MTEITLPGPVKARLVKGALVGGNPGDFKFWRYDADPEAAGLNFICPCGCGGLWGIRFKPSSTSALNEACWTWDGNRKAPTCAPSIRTFESKGGGTHWHGYLREGYFVQA